MLGADISGLALYAAQCCVAPGAHAVQQTASEWIDLGAPHALEEVDAPAGCLAVRPNLSNEHVGRLATHAAERCSW